MKRWLDGLLFPKRCVLCRARLPVSVGATLCDDCAAEVRRKYRVDGLTRVAHADDAAAALRYEGLVRRAMHRYKFRHFKSYARWFAAQTAPVLADKMDAWKPDLITYVPLGFVRARTRGYNQSELIARRLAQQFSVPCQPTLKKRPFATQQSKKSAAERAKHAKNAFLPLSSSSAQGKRVVLVDDILTTGASASACAALLRQAGAERVFVLAVAKTP